MRKKSFTLIEMLISISLFSIIIIFLYETLEQSKNSNQFYNKKLSQLKEKSNIKQILFEDIMNKKHGEKFVIGTDKDKNSIFTFRTLNTYHNPFYTFVTYKIVEENILLRIQSKGKFSEGFIDVVDHNISKFEVVENKNKNISVFIKYNNKDKILLSIIL